MQIRLPNLVLSLGIAAYPDGPSGFHTGYRNAGEALANGLRLRGPGRRTAAKDVVLYRMLGRLAEDPRDAALTVLAPLLDQTGARTPVWSKHS